MNLTSLLNNQKIKIDPHGHYEAIWENKCYEIHLHKETKYKIEGQIQEFEIIVPLNRDEKVRCLNKNKKIKNIPNRIFKEIQEALQNDDLRIQFVRDLNNALKDYTSNYKHQYKVWESLEKIGKAFGFDFSNELFIIKIISEFDEKRFDYYFKNLKKYYNISGSEKDIILQDLSFYEYNEIKRKHSI